MQLQLSEGAPPVRLELLAQRPVRVRVEQIGVRYSTRDPRAAAGRSAVALPDPLPVDLPVRLADTGGGPGARGELSRHPHSQSSRGHGGSLLAPHAGPLPGAHLYSTCVLPLNQNSTSSMKPNVGDSYSTYLSAIKARYITTRDQTQGVLSQVQRSTPGSQVFLLLLDDLGREAIGLGRLHGLRVR